MQFLMPLLVDPLNHKSLTFNEALNEIIEKDSATIYNVENGIADLLPEFSNGFDYLHNYKKDFKLTYLQNKEKLIPLLEKALKGSKLVLNIGDVSLTKSMQSISEKVITLNTDFSSITNENKAYELVANASYLPFKNICFDAIVAVDLLPCIIDEKVVLNNIFRCLKVNGKAVFMADSHDLIFNFIKENQLNYSITQNKEILLVTKGS